jgi:hypothetical protein
MEPIFSLPYSEYAVVNAFGKKFKKQEGFSIFVPASRQQKSVDFLLHHDKTNTCLRFQVKSSRSYINDNPKSLEKGKKRYNLWFGNFIGRYQPNQSDYYVLLGLYPAYAVGTSIDSRKSIWRPMILCLNDQEIRELLAQVKTKREQKQDRFFSIGFDTLKRIYATRGFPVPKDMTHHLLDQKVQAIKDSLTSGHASFTGRRRKLS